MLSNAKPSRSPGALRETAERYRQMALGLTDERTVKALTELAAEYDALAEKMEAGMEACEPER